MNNENSIIKEKRQPELLGLELKQRAEKLSAITGKVFDAEYFAKIHNRSIGLIYRAWRGGAPSLRKKMSQHLDYLEDKYLKEHIIENETEHKLTEAS